MCEISAVLLCHLHACKLLASNALLFTVSAVEYFMKVWWAKTHHSVKLDHLSVTSDLSWPSPLIDYITNYFSIDRTKLTGFNDLTIPLYDL